MKSAMRMRDGLLGQSGQMAVELCAVMPIVLMVAVAVTDSLMFSAVCSSFDHLAPQAILAVAGSPSGVAFDPDASSSEISAVLEERIAHRDVRIAVEPDFDGRICTFACRVSAVPWPLSADGLGMFGFFSPPELSHSVCLAVRPYVIGELG